MAGMDKDNNGKKKLGRPKIHHEKGAPWKLYRATLKEHGYTPMNVNILKERKQDLDELCRETEKTKAFVLGCLIEFAKNNKHLFPRLFGKETNEEGDKKD